MTVSSTTVKQLFSPGISTTTFAIPCEYETESQIKVYTVDESDDPAVETLEVQGVDYSISGSNVVFGTAPNASGTGIKVLIIRSTAQTQATDYDESGDFPADSHELRLDLIVQMIQELQTQINRSILLRLSTSTSGPLSLPEPEAGKFLIWNSDEDGLDNAEIVYGNARSGVSSVTIDTTEHSVSFSASMSGTDYGLSLLWVNTVDGSVMFQPFVVSAKSTSGFTVKWNTPVDTANYSIAYIALPAA